MIGDILGYIDFEYLTKNTHTSMLVAESRRVIGDNVNISKYKYDSRRNITQIKNLGNNITDLCIWWSWKVN